MKVNKTYTIDIETIKKFDSVVPVFQRSIMLGHLMLYFLTELNGDVDYFMKKPRKLK